MIQPNINYTNSLANSRPISISEMVQYFQFASIIIHSTPEGLPPCSGTGYLFHLGDFKAAAAPPVIQKSSTISEVR